MINSVGSSLVYNSPIDFRNMIPNDFKIVEPNDNLQVIISQHVKSGKSIRQILSIMNMIGIQYNVALNNLMFYCLYGQKGRTVREYFEDFYNGILIGPVYISKLTSRY